MSTILIISQSPDDIKHIQSLAENYNLEIIGALDLITAEKKLNSLYIDIICVHHTVNQKYQQALTNIIWSKNPIAHYVVFDFDTEFKQHRDEIKLFGTELAFGSEANNVFAELFRNHTKKNEPLDKHKFNLLVVEDLDSPRDVICFFLEGLGYSSVLGVSSVKEALNELHDSKKTYHCIITDLKMPGLTGIDLIKHVREQDNNISNLPIIVLTAYGTTDKLADCMVAGASGFLIKPPKKQDMLRELSRAMKISIGRLPPRLAKEEDAEMTAKILTDRGLV